MFVVQLRQSACLGVFAVMLLCGPLSQAQTPAQPQDKAAQLKALLKERHVKLSGIAATLLEQFKAGRVEFQAVARAELAALKAGLDAADSPKERLEIFEKCLKLANKTAEIAKAQQAVGQLSPLDVDQAEVLVLEVRIELLREQLKADPPKK